MSVEERKRKNREKMARWREANRERYNARMREWYHNNPEKAKEKNAKRCNYDRRDWILRNKYGITLHDYNTMLAAQGGVCAICKSPPKKNALAVDHCHKTDKIRKLLCCVCNTTVGKEEKNPGLLQRMIYYLDEHKESTP